MTLGQSWDKYMYRFNIFIICFFLSTLVFAQEKTSTAIVSKKTSSGLTITSLSLGYVSWNEILHLNNSGVMDRGASNFSGNSLSFEYEHYSIPRWGWMGDISLLSGQAQLGGTMTTLPYQMGSVNWYGLETSYRGAYRFAKNVVVSAGPVLLARQITIPVDPDGSSVKSGATVNYGLIGNANLRLSNSLELKLSMGTLLSNATTIWSVGLGYIF